MGDFILGLMIIGLMALVALGWIVLLVLGIVLMRRRSRAGLALTITGGVWGIVAIGLGVAAFLFTQATLREFQVTEFDPAAHQGEVGSLRLSYTGDSHLTLRDDERGLVRVRAQQGAAQAPAGDFSVWKWEATARNPEGVLWTASSSPIARPLRVTIGPAATSELDLGPPFIAEVVVTGEKRQRVSLELRVTGAGGHDYTLTAERAGPPRFEALDRSGKVVWSGSFEYG